MKPLCKSVVRTYGTRHIELWCDTCNRMIVLGYKKASTANDDWEADKAKDWRDHLNTVLLAEKARKSSPESVGEASKEHQDTVSIMDLMGMAPNATDGMSAVDFVRQLRDEWD